MDLMLVEGLVVVVVILALICNSMSLYLVFRQGFRQVDMWLAMVMSSSDALVVVYKVLEAVYVHGFGNPDPIFNFGFGQWHGAIVTFLLQMSTACVGYLALLRFWVIFLRRKIDARAWCLGFLVPQAMLLMFLLVVAGKEEFKLKENKRFYYPDLASKDAWVVGCRYLLMLSHLMSVLAVNGCYPCIAWRYVFDLRHFQDAGFRSRVEVRALQIQKAKVLLKILLMVIVYNIVMLPLLVLLICELASGTTLSVTMDNIVVLTLVSLTFVNPLMLLVLHHETWRELKTTLSRFKTRLFPKTQHDPSKLGFRMQRNTSEVALTSVKTLSTSLSNIP